LVSRQVGAGLGHQCSKTGHEVLRLEDHVRATVAIRHKAADNRSVVGLGLNWSRPNEESFGAAAGDQYTAEAYWRFQLATHLSITPDVQIVKDPALDRGQDLVWVLGLRARIFF